MCHHRLICVTLFMLVNLAYIALVAGGYIEPAAAGTYFVIAIAWGLRLGHHRHRHRHRGIGS